MTSKVLAPVIRTMILADLPVVLHIDRLSFPLPWSERTYRFELEENRASCLYVVEVANHGQADVVGYVGLWFVIDEAHISTLAVHPDYRGEGIGERLLQHALDYAFGQGAATVTLEVRVSNRPALSLYYKYGFEVVGKRRGYYRDNSEDAYIMALNILHEGR